MDMQDFVDGCLNCDPRTEPERADELLKAAAELGQAILKNREKASSIPYRKIADSYNSICGNVFPKVTKLTDKRKNLKHMIGYTVKKVKRGGYSAWRNRYYCSADDESFERLRRLDICGKYEDGTSVVYYLTKHGAEILGKILGVKIILEDENND